MRRVVSERAAELLAIAKRDRVTLLAMAAIAVIAVEAGYAGTTGGILALTLPYAQHTFGVSDSELGIGLALVRVGGLLVVPLALFADLGGRRLFVVAAAPLHCVLTAAIALAPTFAVY